MKESVNPLFLLVALATISPAYTQSLSRVSVSSSQVQGNGPSYGGVISANGRHIAFYSIANNLVSGDTAGWSDVFDYDTLTGAIIRVSVPTLGGEADGPSDSPSVSADGRYVAFASFATNLVPSDTNGSYDVFLRDLQAGVTTRVSLDSNGIQANGACGQPSISGDGRFVAFGSSATNLSPTATNGRNHIFVRDLLAGTTVLASVTTSGIQGDFSSTSPSITADGRYVAFMSDATNLVAGDTNGASDIFVRDTQAGTTISATVDPNWIIGNSGSFNPSISADGRYVAFDSTATNFVLGDTNGVRDIFVRDLHSLSFTRASVDSSGVQAQGGSYPSSLSANGRFVAFASDASNLVVADNNGFGDIFIHDNQNGTTKRVNAVNGEGDQSSVTPSISGDGTCVAFLSFASNLVPGDSNAALDVFFYDSIPCGGYPTYCTAKVNSLGCIPEVCADGVASYSGADNFHVTAHHVMNSKSGMLLWSYSQATHPFHGGTLCVGSFHRTPLQNSGGTPSGNDCLGAYTFWFSESYMMAKGIAPGAVVNAQYWSRDPFFPPPDNIGLTDGIQFTVRP